MFPKVPDQHKPGKPLVPNGLGVFYVLTSAIYLFLLFYFDVEDALTLASCILFGGFMGLLDDWIDLRWRYKAFLPLIAVLPLSVSRKGNPWMATYLFGKLYFDVYFFIFVIPIIATVVTNTVNQLGGLNGLETICPSIVLIGLLTVSKPDSQILLYIPIIIYLILAYFNFQGKIFVGNTGSFAIGMTLASYAIIANIEQTLLISIVPYILNSSLVLLNFFLYRRTPSLKVRGNNLSADHRRSLLTLLAYYIHLSERQLTLIVSLLIAVFTLFAVWMNFL